MKNNNKMNNKNNFFSWLRMHINKFLGKGHFFISSPVNGRVIEVKKMKDPTFKILGEGFGLEPKLTTINKVFSPVNGIVKTVFKTGHAYVIKTSTGLECLIHILEFDLTKQIKILTKVKEGQSIKIGDVLCEFGPLSKSLEEKANLTQWVILITNESIKKNSKVEKIKVEKANLYSKWPIEIKASEKVNKVYYFEKVNRFRRFFANIFQ